MKEKLNYSVDLPTAVGTTLSCCLFRPLGKTNFHSPLPNQYYVGFLIYLLSGLSWGSCNFFLLAFSTIIFLSSWVKDLLWVLRQSPSRYLSWFCIWGLRSPPCGFVVPGPIMSQTLARAPFMIWLQILLTWNDSILMLQVSQYLCQLYLKYSVALDHSCWNKGLQVPLEGGWGSYTLYSCYNVTWSFLLETRLLLQQ